VAILAIRSPAAWAQVNAEIRIVTPAESLLYIDAKAEGTVQRFPPVYNSPTMTLSPGTRLGSYEIVAPLGAGGMGESWPIYIVNTCVGRDKH
jgi:hypothetical protein